MINSYASSDDAAVAIAGAWAGADVVRNMYGQRLNRIDKGAGDFATAADVEAEKTILGVIRAARPDDAVLGEEGGQQGAVDAVRQWLVDPLCGTLNYAVGNMLVAVNVALRDGAAAVADPFSGEVFFTDGESTWVRHDGADDALLTPSPATRLVDVNLDPPFPSAPGFRAVDLLAHPGFVERFRPRLVSTTIDPSARMTLRLSRSTAWCSRPGGATRRHASHAGASPSCRPGPRTSAQDLAHPPPVADGPHWR
ncbi:inositol monophosphatase family protein [Streptomyces europaeiscabiei]|uniref:inositol monophosphatase family protein n=1 Tax=Streptomyces europaeiscabiei TaxID=146819 RepID=UPI0038F61B10